jgi:hypothetical protein
VFIGGWPFPVFFSILLEVLFPCLPHESAGLRSAPGDPGKNRFAARRDRARIDDAGISTGGKPKDAQIGMCRFPSARIENAEVKSIQQSQAAAIRAPLITTYKIDS